MIKVLWSAVAAAVLVSAISLFALSSPAESAVTRPVCKVTLTLVSIEVLDDTEIGQEEWEIRTSSRVLGGSLRTVEVEADVGEGEVEINEVIGTRTSDKAAFPLTEREVLRARVTELDNFAHERHTEVEYPFSNLDCPQSETVEMIVIGFGIDPETVLTKVENFEVRLKYRYDVVPVSSG